MTDWERNYFKLISSSSSPAQRHITYWLGQLKGQRGNLASLNMCTFSQRVNCYFSFFFFVILFAFIDILILITNRESEILWNKSSGLFVLTTCPLELLELCWSSGNTFHLSLTVKVSKTRVWTCLFTQISHFFSLSPSGWASTGVETAIKWRFGEWVKRINSKKGRGSVFPLSIRWNNSPVGWSNVSVAATATAAAKVIKVHHIQLVSRRARRNEKRWNHCPGFPNCNSRFYYTHFTHKCRVHCSTARVTSTKNTSSPGSTGHEWTCWWLQGRAIIKIIDLPFGTFPTRRPRNHSSCFPLSHFPFRSSLQLTLKFSWEQVITHYLVLFHLHFRGTCSCCDVNDLFFPRVTHWTVNIFILQAVWVTVFSLQKKRSRKLNRLSKLLTWTEQDLQWNTDSIYLRVLKITGSFFISFFFLLGLKG